MLNFVKKFFSTKENKPIKLEEIEEIIQSYAAIMGSPDAPIIRNTQDLPHPKEKIKTALKIAIKITEDPGMCEHLKSGYIMLADWQDNYDGKQLDTSSADISPEEAITLMESQKHWAEKVQKEAEVLLEDLESL